MHSQALIQKSNAFRRFSSLLDRKFYVFGSGVHAEASPRLLLVPHVHTHLFDCHHVGKSRSVAQPTHFSQIRNTHALNSLPFAVGIVLDQTGSSAGTCYTRRDFAAHLIDSAREIASVAAARVLSQSGRRVHVGVHDFRVHGAHGVLLGEHRAGRLGATQAGAAATAPARTEAARVYEFEGEFAISILHTIKYREKISQNKG